MSRFFLNTAVVTKDRFDISKFFEFNVDNYDPLTSAFSEDLLDLTQGGIYTVQGEDGKPNLVSYRALGSNQYWWVLMLYNNKLDFQDISTGEELPLPSLDALESLYFSLKAKETASQA